MNEPNLWSCLYNMQTNLAIIAQIERVMLEITVNGILYSLEELPGEKLSDLLRERLRLTGTKIGCGEGRCSICTVLVDGVPTRSCITRASKVNGKSILTIEGLRALRPDHQQDQRGDLKALHPLQEAFITHGAIQCGFCTPGQLLTAYALLQNNPDPSVAEIREAMNDVICRCGSYEAIVSAIQAAAQALNEDKAIAPRQVPLGEQDLNHVGKAVSRPDAVSKAIGNAKFTDDLHFEGMLFARVLRAGVPSAILRGLDISRAEALPGVVKILTAKDLQHEHFQGTYKKDWPILIGFGERVRYQGDAIAILAAETQAIADEALKLVHPEFELRPVVSCPQQAHQENAERLHDDGNLLKHIHFNKGDLQVGFSESDAIIEHTFSTPFMEHLFMEPECSIAVPQENGGLDLYVGSQIPFEDRLQVAEATGLPVEKVRIRGQKTGGAFGGKEDIAGQIHAALLALATRRPVKLLFTRRESMLVHPKRHATTIKIRLGAKKDGTLTAIQTELFGDTGAYASLGVPVMTRATTHSCGPYVIPHTHADCYAMYTNNPPAGAFRGFGVVQAAFGIESAMDMLAKELQIDPMTMRKKNCLHIGSTTNTGHYLTESVGLPDCLDAISDWWAQNGINTPFEPQTEEVGGQSLLTCWGLACGFKNTGLGTGADDSSGVILKLMPAGRLQIKSGASEVGQGMVTTLQLIAAEVLSIPPENINIYLMDTALTPDGGATTASRQTYVTGNAVRQAATQLKERILELLEKLLGISVGEIRFSADGAHYAERLIPWQEIHDLLKQTPEGLEVECRYRAPETFPLEVGGRIHIAYGFAVQAVKVGINLQTGEVKALQVVAANDAGRVINPLGFQSQVEGGVVMGVGHALMEDFKVEEGVIKSDRIARYDVPRMQDLPEITSIIVESHTSEGPFGAKGIGELVCVPTSPAITNAIYHAIGLRIDTLPVTKEKILNWLARS